MSSPSRAKLLVDYQKLSILPFGNVVLEHSSTFLYSDNKLLGFEYDVMVDGKRAGSLMTSLINNNFDIQAADGNLGLVLDAPFRNKDIPYMATKAIAPLFAHFGQSKLTITFKKGKRSIEDVCKRLNGEWLDSITDDLDVIKTRYLVSL